MDKFLRADLFAALSEFVSHAHGSFGLQAISSSEPHTVMKIICRSVERKSDAIVVETSSSSSLFNTGNTRRG